MLIVLLITFLVVWGIFATKRSLATSESKTTTETNAQIEEEGEEVYWLEGEDYWLKRYSEELSYMMPADITAQIRFGMAMQCPGYPPEVVNSESQDKTCKPSPPVPLLYLRSLGYDSYFTAGGKIFPYSSTLCTDIDIPRNSAEWIMECLKRNKIDINSIPGFEPPPNWVKPPQLLEKEGKAPEFFSILTGGRMTLEGKIGYTQMQFPRARRGMGLRISPAALESLEQSLEGYINNIINDVINCNCEQNTGSDYCRSCCVRPPADSPQGTCCRTDPISGRCLIKNCARWCNTGECPPSASQPPAQTCGGIPCPASSCPENPYQCIDIPVFGDCAMKDSMMCPAYSYCNVVGGSRCAQVGPINIEAADCPNFNIFSCPTDNNNCGNDGLIVDLYIGQTAIEMFGRIANYVAKIQGCTNNDCNSGTTERTCSSNCGQNQTCNCRCCSGAQAGCGVFHWPPGCPCCDDRIRVDIVFPGLNIYGIAFLLYGPSGSPFFTACGSQAGTWKVNYPGEWLNLCACAQNANVFGADPDICDFGFLNVCGMIADLFIGEEEVRCQVVGLVNDVLGGAISNSLGGTLPISAMEALGACNTTAYDLGIYPEFCAGGSLGYSGSYSTGGRGINLFTDLAVRVNTPNSCVLGTCPQYPTQANLSICSNTGAATNVHNCLPNLNNYDIGIFISEESINQLFYLLWTQGYLCQSFILPESVAKIVIPGIRQIFPTTPTVQVSFIPVCTNPTPRFTTSGNTFFINIPELRVRFRACNTPACATQLFDMQVRLDIQGQLQAVQGGCHPLDTLCQQNPTFRCRRCNNNGCWTDYIPYGGGWLQLSNVIINPDVFGITNTHPQINLTPPFTEIADVIGNLLNGYLDQGLITTRIYNLILVPLRIQSLTAFGFMNNALVARLDLPDPFCLNFILDFGNFAPSADTLYRMVKDGFWPISVSPATYLLNSGEITLEEFEKLTAHPETENKINTLISVYEIGKNGERLAPKAENSKTIEIRIPALSKGVEIKALAEFSGFYPDENSEVHIVWKRKDGYMWNAMPNGVLKYRPINPYEEIEILAYVKKKYDPENPQEIILAYDTKPAILRVIRGVLEGKVVGPDKVKAGETMEFEITPNVEKVSYSIDGGKSWVGPILNSKFSVYFPYGLTEAKLDVIFIRGEEEGYASKTITVEEGTGMCGSMLGLLGIFLIILPAALLMIRKYRNGKNGKSNNGHNHVRI